MTETKLDKLPKARVKDFSFINPAGGTGLSDWLHNKRFTAVADVRVLKGWFDYETGLHFIGVGDSDALNTYLGEVCDPQNRKVYFSELALVSPRQGMSLMRQLANLAGVVKTSDGYSFERQPDGTWSDGDLSWPSIDALMDENDVVPEVNLMQQQEPKKDCD